MREKKWTLISKQKVFQNRWMNVDDWEMRTVTGHVGHYFIEYLEGVVVIFGLTDDRNVVAVREYYPAHQQYAISLPAGIVEHNDPDQTARDEFRQEAGCVAKNWTYLGDCYLAKYKTGKAYFYLAQDITKVGDPELEPSEDLEMLYIPLEKFIRMLRNCEIQDQAEIACSYLALDRLGLLKL